jgi:hypothetical protein
MANLIDNLAKRHTLEEIFPPSDPYGAEITYDLLLARSILLDALIKEARGVKPVQVILTSDGGVHVDNPSELPLSVQDFDIDPGTEIEDFSQFEEMYGNAARVGDDGDYYIERGNQ